MTNKIYIAIAFCLFFCSIIKAQKVQEFHYVLDTNDIYQNLPEIAEDILKKYSYSKEISIMLTQRIDGFYDVIEKGFMTGFFRDMVIQIKDSSIIYREENDTSTYNYLDLKQIKDGHYTHSFQLKNYKEKHFKRVEFYDKIDTLSEEARFIALQGFNYIEFDKSYNIGTSKEQYKIYKFKLSRLTYNSYFILFTPDKGIIGVGFQDIVSYNPIKHNNRGELSYDFIYYLKKN